MRAGMERDNTNGSAALLQGYVRLHVRSDHATLGPLARATLRTGIDSGSAPFTFSSDSITRSFTVQHHPHCQRRQPSPGPSDTTGQQSQRKFCVERYVIIGSHPSESTRRRVKVGRVSVRDQVAVPALIMKQVPHLDIVAPVTHHSDRSTRDA
jgi:hypothetical protein